ncbi:MAG TPA: CBS domain-containing protein, partial [Polyangiales bacterium]
LSLDAAALLMLEQPGQTLPVVDAAGLVIGTLSDAELQLEIQAARNESGTVLAAMTPCPLLIPESTPITRAAAVMAFEGVSCLVVVSPAGSVSGVLMATDLLSWLARADGYLARPRSSRPPAR